MKKFRHIGYPLIGYLLISSCTLQSYYEGNESYIQQAYSPKTQRAIKSTFTSVGFVLGWGIAYPLIERQFEEQLTRNRWQRFLSESSEFMKVFTKIFAAGSFGLVASGLGDTLHKSCYPPQAEKS